MNLKLFITFLLLSFELIAQNPVVFQFTEKDGLPDIEFYNILEDKKGFIWLAADKGLYRYNGKDFKIYNNPVKKGLSVFELSEDSKGRIWCVNISGQIFYIENDILINFIDLGNLLNGELVNYKVREKDVLVFSSSTIYQINLTTKKKEVVFKSQKAIGKPFVYKNLLLVCIDRIVYSIIENKLIKYSTLEDKSLEAEKESKSVLFNQNNNLFLLKYFLNIQTELYYKANDKFFKKLKLPTELLDKRIIDVFEKNNLIWFCTSNGVFVYEFKNNQFIYKNLYLEDNFISKMLVDKNQNYWFSSIKSGIYVIPNINIHQFNTSLLDQNLSCLEKMDNENFFFGTLNGIIGIYNFQKNQVQTIRLSSKNKVTALHYNSSKETLLISQENKSFTYDIKSKFLKEINTFINAKNLICINENRTLFTTFDGAYYLDGFYNKSAILPTKSGYKRTYTSHVSKKGNKTYVAYVDDLCVYDSKLNYEVVKYNGKSIFAISITETSNGLVFVSTFKDGIFVIKDQKIIQHLTDKNGLLSNQAGLLKEDGNKLWIVTDKGIQLYDSIHGVYKNLTETDGIISYNISGIEVFHDKVFFASNKGVFSVDKELAFKNKVHPQIYFTSVEVNEENVHFKENNNLDYKTNSIKFNFNTNGFLSNQKFKYKYRLKGLEDKWINLDDKVTFVKYNSLSSGDYIFQISFQDDSNFKEIQFTIEKPFWEKWWFIMLSTLALISGIILYFNLRIKKIKSRQQEELQKELTSKKLVLSQLEALRSQMNPHFIFNALNSIQEYIVFNNKDLASNYLIKFSRLIRIYLEHSQVNEVALKEEIEALKLYLELEKIRFEDVLKYNLFIDENINQESVKIPTLFIQPYVENAIKHGLLHKKGDRILNITFNLDEYKKNVICIIEDNGIGIKASSELNKNKFNKPASFATSANEKRLSLINIGKKNKIEVETINLIDNEVPNGTKVCIKIPLNYT